MLRREVRQCTERMMVQDRFELLRSGCDATKHWGTKRSGSEKESLAYSHMILNLNGGRRKEVDADG